MITVISVVFLFFQISNQILIISMILKKIQFYCHLKYRQWEINILCMHSIYIDKHPK